jgi:hypothetical protein
MIRKKFAVLFMLASLGIFPFAAQAADSGGTGKGGDVPVTPGIQSDDDYTTNAGDSGTGKGGDVPVTPGIQSDDDYSTNAGDTGTGKGGDIPVTPG